MKHVLPDPVLLHALAPLVLALLLALPDTGQALSVLLGRHPFAKLEKLVKIELPVPLSTLLVRVDRRERRVKVLAAVFSVVDERREDV